MLQYWLEEKIIDFFDEETKELLFSFFTGMDLCQKKNALLCLLTIFNNNNNNRNGKR